MSFRAKYAGTCKHCKTPINVGQSISGGRSTGYWHASCAPSQDSRADQQYWRGRNEGHQYSQNVKTYGRELAEQWEMEAEMARYNRGEDW